VKGKSALEIMASIKREYEKRLIYDEYVKKYHKCTTTEIPIFLYVFSNVAELQLVGNKYARLLRTVEVPSDDRKTFSKDWNPPVFKSVSGNYFNHIEIDIRDQKGCPVSFLQGPLILTLLFTPIRPKAYN